MIYNISMEQTEEVTTVTEAPAAVIKTTKQVAPQVRTEHPQKVYAKKKAVFRTHQIIWYILGLIEVLLGFRITLLALGANPSSGFVSLIYTLTNPLALPFQGILRTYITSTGTVTGAVFEWSSIIAGIVYALIAVGIAQLMQFLKPVSPQEVSEAVDTV